MQNIPNEIRVDVRSTIDIVTARQKGREVAMILGFEGAEVTLIAAAISEVARNVVDHAKSGEVVITYVKRDTRRGIQVIALDNGPGIEDLEEALQYGYSTKRGLGVGLPGAKWLMDEFEIVSKPNQGTTVTMRKWVNDNGANIGISH